VVERFHALLLLKQQRALPPQVAGDPVGEVGKEGGQVDLDTDIGVSHIDAAGEGLTEALRLEAQAIAVPR
jgi:hypothetical protein